MLLGFVVLSWMAVLFAIIKGLPVLLYGVTPLCAGWFIYKGAKPDVATPTTELKGGWAKLRSILIDALTPKK